GGLKIGALHTPGHTDGMLNFVVNGSDVFTADTLFKNSVGGVRAPGSTSFEDLRSSIMDVLMELDPKTRLHPGHTDPTTVGDEWENNRFIRLWRGLDDEGTEKCTVGEDSATLVLWGDDYDGGHKAWVRWDGSGKDDIVPGSQVVREGDEPATD
ncbi:MAG: MBL fold metallo-hydrolase, partial [Actinomycetota bacterium]